MIKHTFLFYFIAVILLLSCRNTGEVRDQIDAEEVTGFDDFNEVKEVYYRFPSPDEMLSIIDKKEIFFNDDFIHQPNKAGSYLDSKSQALNLGIYIADLAYVTLFDRQKEALVYLQIIYGLSDKLRISTAFDMASAKSFEDNLGNLDSLKVLADEALTDITTYLIREDKERVLAVISIGAYVESLYLAFQMVDKYSEDNLIIQRISDQKLVMENLLNYSLEFADDNNVSDAIDLIQPIREVFGKLAADSEETEVKKDDTGKLIISGGDKITITEEQFEELKNATISVRQKIIDNQEN